MKNLSLIFAAALFAPVIFFRCNIEVGNPDGGEAVLPGRASFSMQMLQADQCVAADAGCTSVPVTTDPAMNLALRFDMTQASFDLASVTLAPFSEQGSRTLVDLIQGASISVSEYKMLQVPESVMLRFEARTGAQAAATLTGTLQGQVDGKPVSMPLLIPIDSRIDAFTAVPAGDGVLGQVVFDPKIWFDFTGAGPDVSKALRQIALGACSVTDSKLCLQYRDQITRRIAWQIAHSAKASRRR